MSEHLTRNITAALAARRPAPARDLALRLAAAARAPSRRRIVVPALLAASVAALALIVVVTRPTGSDERPVAPDRLPAPQAPRVSAAHPAIQTQDCMSCHEHATVHDRRYTNQQCLSCHAVQTDAALELERKRFATKHATVQDRMTEPCRSCHPDVRTDATVPPRMR